MQIGTHLSGIGLQQKQASDFQAVFYIAGQTIQTMCLKHQLNSTDDQRSLVTKSTTNIFLKKITYIILP